MNEAAIPEGVIVGGWGYVIAAYSVTGAVLLLYALSLVSRLRRTKEQAPEPVGSTKES